MTMDNGPVKEIVTVTEMAEMLCMSRSRLYQLIRQGILLPPIYSLVSRKPFYPRKIQSRNLEAKRTNCGVNGEPVLFYARRVIPVTPRVRRSAKRKSRVKQGGGNSDLVEVLGQLGLDVNADNVSSAVSSCYPNGVVGIAEGEVIRTVFRFLKQSKCQNTSDNVR
jgi:predicted DNA-binding transcriptional regulator AlpA